MIKIINFIEFKERKTIHKIFQNSLGFRVNKFLIIFLLKPYRFEKIIYGFFGGGKLFQPILIL